MEKSKTINNLMDEHEAIRITLNILNRLDSLAEKNIAIERADIDRLVDFLKVFADQCHHGKEEQYLFTEGVVSDNELPLSRKTILEDHEQARRYIHQMEKVLQAATGTQVVLPPEFRRVAEEYTRLLRKHIETENEQLFPVFVKALSVEQDNALFQKFAQFESEVIGEGVHELYHHLLDYLDDKYLKAKV